MYRKTEAVVDLDAIRDNFALAAKLAPGSRNVAVIKANGYGHGLVPVAEALRQDAPVLAVAILDEALELRAAGVTGPLLVLEGVNGRSAVETAAANGLALVVHSLEQIDAMCRARLPQPVHTWLKVDTGMHRLGLLPAQLGSALERLGDCACEVEVVCTHLACADEADNDFTEKQLEAFRSATAGLGLPVSIANSAGILAWPDSHAEWNRPGYMLYGNSPMSKRIETATELTPAMTLRSELIAIREIGAGESVGYGGRWTASRPSRIGTVAIGYSDGYPRHAPNGTPTFVNGSIAPLVGTVSMDMITIDLTGVDRAEVGDGVELWGPNVSVGDVASMSGTIGYELLTHVTARVPRIYRDES